MVTVSLAVGPTPCDAFASTVKITVTLGLGTPSLIGTMVSVTVLCPARNKIGLAMVL